MRTPDFQFICEWMLEETGILFRDEDRGFIESRLYDVAAGRGMFTVDELMDEYRANKSPKLEREIMDALVNDETHFFRNFVAFKHLRNVAIPKILESRGESDEPIKLWCAGASSGQEPYSISIMYHEAMPALKKVGLEIWATDISQTLINRAIAGRYTTQEVSRHVPDKIIQVLDIPKTINNKPVEKAVSQIINGETVKNLQSIANPESLQYFKSLK